METDDDVFKAPPQVKGSIAHHGVDAKKGSTRAADLFSLSVFSDELGISGKIDLLKQDRKTLIERKNNLKHIFRGQLYQLWGQYFCLKEMGFDVERLAFYEISTNKMIDVPLPGDVEKLELIDFVERFKKYVPGTTPINTNPNKCAHCIYCNLCDKTNTDNVYT